MLRSKKCTFRIVEVCLCCADGGVEFVNNGEWAVVEEEMSLSDLALPSQNPLLQNCETVESGPAAP
jgi:hypothetical protein